MKNWPGLVAFSLLPPLSGVKISGNWRRLRLVSRSNVQPPAVTRVRAVTFWIVQSPSVFIGTFWQSVLFSAYPAGTLISCASHVSPVLKPLTLKDAGEL